MKIQIIHPSRHRPHQALATRSKWLERCNWRVNYMFSFDSDDDSIPPGVSGLRLPNKTAIEAINNAAASTFGWDILMVVSDDSDCPYDWDLKLAKEIEGKSDFVVKTRDGIQKLLVTMPIVDKVWYNRYGYIYNPEYDHMYCDQELTAVAMMTGRLIMSDLEFLHLHYSTGKSPKDSINDKNDATYPQGLKVFDRHLSEGFGIKSPVMTYEQIKWHD
jgi:hypothetical protein